MRRFFMLVFILMAFTGCSDDVRGGPWQISEQGNTAVADSQVANDAADTSADTTRMGPQFVGEAHLLATALERIAVIARDQNSSLCVFMVLVWPVGPAMYTDVEMQEEWGVESIVARPEGCPGPQWPARDGLPPESATGRIDVYQSMGADRFTSVGVDVVLGFPTNEQDVPRQIVLEFPNLEL